MPIIACRGPSVWFLLVGLFWYARPGDLLWFAGSMALETGYFSAFFWYVTRPK